MKIKRKHQKEAMVNYLQNKLENGSQSEHRQLTIYNIQEIIDILDPKIKLRKRRNKDFLYVTVTRKRFIKIKKGKEL